MKIMLKINKFHIRKFRKVLCFMLLLCVSMNWKVMAANASDNFEIPEIQKSEMDDYLIKYMKESIPDDSLWVESDTINNFIQTSKHNKGIKTNLSDKVKGMVYTFTSQDNSEPVYHTVIDFYFVEKIKTSTKDSLEINMNDYLRPSSPAKGELLIKDKVDQEWKASKDVDVIVNLSAALVYGDQINSSHDFTRIILSFSSDKNPDSKEDMPRYFIDYTNQTGSAWWGIVWGIGLVSIIALIIIFFHFRGKRTSGS